MWKWMCGRCPGIELIWGGDQIAEDEPHQVTSNFTCPSCEVYVEVSHG